MYLARTIVEGHLQFGKESITIEEAAYSLFDRFPKLNVCSVGEIYQKSPDRFGIRNLVAFYKPDLNAIEWMKALHLSNMT